jgi:hypothetical protein
MELADPFTPAELAIRLDEWASCQDDPQAELVTDLRRTAARLRHLSAQAEPGYVVKPLEWRGPISSYPTTIWEAKTTFGHYVIEEVSASDCPAYEVRLLMSLVAVKDTVDEAEAAAQADYAQRIRSAITTVGTAEPGYVAGFEACREAALDVVKSRRWSEEIKSNTNGARTYGNEEACDFIGAAIAALPAPATASVGEEVTGFPSNDHIVDIWRAAMTVALNIVIQRQNVLNEDDGPMNVLDEQDEIISKLNKFLEPDEDYIAELRQMIESTKRSAT